VKRDHANSDRALLQDQLRKRLELLLVLCEDKHVRYFWGPTNPFRTPIEALTAVSTASYNH
jgi:hypothetical protein